MKSGRSLHSSIAALAVIASLSGCGLHGKPAVERKAAPLPGRAGPVSAARAEVVRPARVIAPGIVESWGGDTQLSAKESGWIDQVRVREGESVRAGQLLVVLDDASQRRAVEPARADVAEADAALARIEVGSTAEELRRALADREAAAARAEFARSDAERASRLVDGGAVAVAEAERRSAEARALAALAAGAQARLEEIERGPRAEDRRVVAPGAGTVLGSPSSRLPRARTSGCTRCSWRSPPPPGSSPGSGCGGMSRGSSWPAATATSVLGPRGTPAPREAPAGKERASGSWATP